MGVGTVTFLCIGVALRALQYFSNTSQWLDEVMLSWSVVHRNLPELLTTPLAYGQAAPPGILAAERIAVVALGPSDLALRLFPFLCSIVALLAGFRLARWKLSPLGQLAFVALLAVAAPLILYSGQAKQYSVDVAVASIILLAVTTSLPAGISRRRAWVLALVGFTAVWFSTPAPLMLCGASMALLWPLARSGVTRQEYLWRRLPVVVTWTVASMASPDRRPRQCLGGDEGDPAGLLD
ncbi:MAG: hypothetical protein WDO12_04585 [Pseudomonadota bacterium]